MLCTTGVLLRVLVSEGSRRCRSKMKHVKDAISDITHIIMVLLNCLYLLLNHKHIVLILGKYLSSCFSYTMLVNLSYSGGRKNWLLAMTDMLCSKIHFINCKFELARKIY